LLAARSQNTVDTGVDDILQRLVQIHGHVECAVEGGVQWPG
jgi:hypothetical protein